jgi:cell wall-associated NlpC family hydrolase
MTTQHYKKKRFGFWGYFFIVMGVLAVLSFLLTRCDIREMKWKKDNRNNPIVSPVPPHAGFTPGPTSPIANPIAPILSPTPSATPTQTPNNGLGSADDGIIKPDGDLLDPDGNNVNDMAQGDLGIITPRATLTKVYPQNTDVDAMIEYAKKYLGTPYEFGSNRRTDTTFDCSDATQWFYKKLGMQLPLDSRAQQSYIAQFGTHRWTDWRRATPGDLFFFSSYRGTQKENYADVQRGVSTVTHVGLYIGQDENGKHLMLHSPSAPKGVRIDAIDGRHWEWRLIYNGRPF